MTTKKSNHANPVFKQQRRPGPVWLAWLVWLALVVVVGARAAEVPVGTSGEVVTAHLRARLVAQRPWVAPGESVELLLVFDLQPGWHTYWRNPGDSGEPPRLTWTLPEGIRAGAIRWPYPRRIPVGPLANYGYTGQALHLIDLDVAADWPAGEPIDLRLDATWLVCDEHCVPESGSFALRLESAPGVGETSGDALLEAMFARARAAVPTDFAGEALLDRSGKPLRLRLSRAALPEDLQGLEFFADAWGLIEPAAAQPWRFEGDWLELRLTAGANVAGASISGVVVASATDGWHAFELKPREQTLPPLPAGADSVPLGLPLALLFAFLGGVILNLMPCVFPVLAIKLLGLAEQGTLSRAARAWHAALYSAGVLVFFALLGGGLLVLRAAGTAAGWGFQLQSPAFVALMAGLFLVLGLSLAGVLTLGTGLMGLGAGGRVLNTGMSGRVGFDRAALAAFGTGALAALVAAPCTAPFMGAALGYALTLPWLAALAVMLMLGFGMALPFALLSLFPAWARRLPRPGVWMERLKQLLAFPLFATAAWLLWVLVLQTGADGLGLAMGSLLALVFGLWLLEVVRADGSRWAGGARLAVRGLALVCLVGALGLAIRLEPPASEDAGLLAQPYSAEALAQALGSGQPVFVNMTAAWCITCLVNERVALATERVARAFADAQVVYFKGDWTNHDPNISAYLNSFGRDGVPLYVFYPPGGEPVMLPQLLTPGLVVDALRAR